MFCERAFRQLFNVECGIEGWTIRGVFYPRV